MTAPIEIVEVGPRDGLQNEKALLEVDQKLEFIHRLEAAGARRIETVSFVNPKRVPQMAGAEEISPPCRPPGRSRIGLVLNERGWDRCVAARLRRGQCRGLRHRRLRHPQPGRLGRGADRRHAGHRRAPAGRGRPADHRDHLGGLRLPLRRGGLRGTGGRASSARRPRRASPRSPWPTPSASPTRGWCGAGRGAPRPPRRARRCACTSTTPATPASPTPTPASRRASTCWTPAAAAWAAAPSRRTPPATSAPRTWSTCWSAPASRPATTCRRLIGAAKWMAGLLGKPPAASVSRAGRFPLPA